MKSVATLLAKLSFSLFAISFLLNFLWESFHGAFLYSMGGFDIQSYVLLMGRCAVVDGLLILLIYGIVALVWKNIFWLRSPNAPQIAFFSAVGVFIAVFIEYRALFITHAWRYSELMPTIFGIGISPLVQLVVTGIVSLYASRLLNLEQ